MIGFHHYNRNSISVARDPAGWRVLRIATSHLGDDAHGRRCRQLE